MTVATRDLTALGWCLGEIRQALTQSAQLLEQRLQAEQGDFGGMAAARPGEDTP